MQLSQIQALSQELSPLLSGARLQGLRRHRQGLFSLEFYSQEKHFVLLELQRPRSVCFLTQQLPPSKPADSLTLGLRKHLLGSRLRSLSQLQQDRILAWDFETATGPMRLILELSGRHANLFLLDAQARVMQQLYPDASARGLHHRSAYRPPEFRPAPATQDPLKLAELPADGSRSRALADFYQRQGSQTHQIALLQGAERNLGRRLRRAHQQVSRLQGDIDGLDAASLWQRRGELLQSAYGKVAKGQTEVKVPDYFQADQPEVTIQLDPALDLAGNVQKCFQRSRKRERAAERAIELLEAAETEVAGLEALLRELEAWRTLAQAGTALAAETVERLAALQPLSPRAPSATQAIRLPYREFISLTGQRILVGRSARDNDALTLRHARGQDLWLHVRDWTGSHVIVPLSKQQQVHAETLLDAATLALHYSQAGPGGEAEIAYTPRKFVQKIKGAPAGQVHLASFKTLKLRLEPERLKRLLASPAETAYPVAESGSDTVS